jgi:hypothetical protein
MAIPIYTGGKLSWQGYIYKLHEQADGNLIPYEYSPFGVRPVDDNMPDYLTFKNYEDRNGRALEVVKYVVVEKSEDQLFYERFMAEFGNE